MYARGILFGTMIYEVSDKCSVTCEKNDLVAEIEFKSKVSFSFFSFLFFFSFISFPLFFISFHILNNGDEFRIK